MTPSQMVGANTCARVSPAGPIPGTPAFVPHLHAGDSAEELPQQASEVADPHPDALQPDLWGWWERDGRPGEGHRGPLRRREGQMQMSTKSSRCAQKVCFSGACASKIVAETHWHQKIVFRTRGGGSGGPELEVNIKGHTLH